LIGENRDGVFLIPDVAYLKANYDDGNGAGLVHMMNLCGEDPFDKVDISIQKMTIDMRHQLVMGEGTITYNVTGHGIRIAQGWKDGQFMVNQVTIRNVDIYGIGIQDRFGYPKSNVALTNLHIERTGSDAIDTKEASGDGNRNLVIRNVTVNKIGFLTRGPANAIDVRYRDVIIDNVNLVSQVSRSTLPGRRSSSDTGINFRAFEAGAAGIVQATISNVYIRGFSAGIVISSSGIPHRNIAISDFKIHGQGGAGISITGSNHSGHSISNGYIDPNFGTTTMNLRGMASVYNVNVARWDPSLSAATETIFENKASLAGQVFSPAWKGLVGVEQMSLNPTSSKQGQLDVDVSSGVLQIDYDGAFNGMDKLIVKGNLKLSGELRVKLVDGLPSKGGTFQIFEADFISGSFTNFSLPQVPDYKWITDRIAKDGTISLVEL
jgi:hypothetical protein